MKALYAGSFDPVTLGHLDIIKRGSNLFTELNLLITTNPKKKPFFSHGTRADLLTPHMPENVGFVEPTGKLTVEVAKDNKCDVLIRGIRTVTDWEFEYAMALANKSYGVETLFLPASTEVAFISSTLIKEAWSFGGDIRQWVPLNVVKAFEYYRKTMGGPLDDIKKVLTLSSFKASPYTPCEYELGNGNCGRKESMKNMSCHQQNCPWKDRQANNDWWKNHPGRWKG